MKQLTSRPPTRALQATAHHEAGHAVIALALGRAVSMVTIVPDEESGSLGRCVSPHLPALTQIDSLPPKRARDLLERQALISFAGGHAEAHFQGRRNRIGEQGDLEKAIGLMGRLCRDEEEATAYANLLRIQARNLVRQEHHWHAIQAVAAALLEQRTLTGRQVREVIDRAEQELRERWSQAG